MRIVHGDKDITLYLGRAEEWKNDEWVDLVLTNPYGPMPTGLEKTPAIIHQWGHRKKDAVLWSHMSLPFLLGRWNDERECFWGNQYLINPRQIDIRRFRPEPGGWYPEDLVRQLLTEFAQPGWTIWDGFMGRGTVGKIAREMGMKYIGINELSDHMDLALNYLELT